MRRRELAQRSWPEEAKKLMIEAAVRRRVRAGRAPNGGLPPTRRIVALGFFEPKLERNFVAGRPASVMRMKCVITPSRVTNAASVAVGGPSLVSEIAVGNGLILSARSKKGWRADDARRAEEDPRSSPISSGRRGEMNRDVTEAGGRVLAVGRSFEGRRNVLAGFDREGTPVPLRQREEAGGGRASCFEPSSLPSRRRTGFTVRHGTLSAKMMPWWAI